MDGEEEILLLRINALKSTTRVHGTNHVQETVDDKKAIKVVCNGNAKKDFHTEKTMVVDGPSTYDVTPVFTAKTQTLVKPVVKNEKSACHELKLRQEALMSLLQKRVTKTENLIKKNVQNVQHTGISSTSRQRTTSRLKIKVTNNSTVKLQTLQLETECSGFSIGIGNVSGERKGEVTGTEQNENPGYLSSLTDDEKLCTSDLSPLFIKEGKTQIQHDGISVNRKISIGSDDEISLCASEQQEIDDVSEVSAKPNTGAEAHEKNIEACKVQYNEISCSEADAENDEICDAVGFTLPSVCLNNSLTGSGKTFASTSKNTGQIIEILTDLALNSSTGNVDASGKNNADCEPGPSGFHLISHDSDSDDSIVEVSGPNKSVPIVIELSSSDESSYSGKGKHKKKKKKTFKDILSRNIGLDGSREDLQDMSCAICLGPFENRSFADKCFHSFCYVCVIQWSELSRLCPLCKAEYSSLIHSVTKDLEYEQYVFPEKATKVKHESRRNTRREFSETMPDGRRFRYRSTVVDTETWALRRAEREKAERKRILSRDQRKIERRLKWSATKDRRKAVYQTNMVLKEVKQRGKRTVRNICPAFFEENPAMKHRLVPWLLRDLNVLLGNDDDSIRFVMSLVLNLISKISMKSEEFREQLQPLLFEKTDQFVQELISFSSSPYDIGGYDDNVVYDVPTQSEQQRNATIEICDDVTTTPVDPFRERLLREVFLGSEEIDSPSNELTNANSGGNHVDFENEQSQSDEKSSTPEAAGPMGEKGAKPPAMEASQKEDRALVDLEQDESYETNEEEELHEKKKKKRKLKKKKKKSKAKKKQKSRSLENLDDDVECPRDDETGISRRKEENDKGGSTGEADKKVDREISHDITEETLKNKTITEAADETSSVTEKNVVTVTQRADEDDKHVGTCSLDEGLQHETFESKSRRKHKKKHKKKHKMHDRRKTETESSDKEEEADNVKSAASSHTERRKKRSKESRHRDRSLSGKNRKHNCDQPNSPERKKRDAKGRFESETESKRHRKASHLNERRSKDTVICRKRSLTENCENVVSKRRRSSSVENSRKCQSKERKQKHQSKHKRKRKKRKTRTSSDFPSNEAVQSKDNLEGSGEDNLPQSGPYEEEILRMFSDNEDGKERYEEYLHHLKSNKELVKVGNSYKTRAEVVQELLMIERAIDRKKVAKNEGKKINKLSQVSSRLDANIDEAVEQAVNELDNLGKKKVENERSYFHLIKELQDIEGSINSCRSTLQFKSTLL